MKRIQITYTTDDIGPEYAKAIRAARTKEALVESIKYFMPVVDDALKCAKKLTDDDFKDFQRDIIKAGKQQPDEWVDKFNERFGVIAIPTKLLLSSLTAEQFKVPWGCAYMRCEELGWK